MGPARRRVHADGRGREPAREAVRKHTEMLSPAPDPSSSSQQRVLAASVGSDGAVVLDLVIRDEASTGGGDEECAGG